MSQSKSNYAESPYLKIALSLYADQMTERTPKAQRGFAENLSGLFLGKEKRKPVLSEKGRELVDALFLKIDQEKLKTKKAVTIVSPEVFSEQVYQTYFALNEDEMDAHVAKSLNAFGAMYDDHYENEYSDDLDRHEQKGQLLIDTVQEALNDKIVETIDSFNEPNPSAYDGYELHIRKNFDQLKLA